MNKERHVQAQSEFLEFICGQEVVLRGGTCLSLFYGLPRFTESLQFDSENVTLREQVKEFCRERGYSHLTARDVDTLKVYYVHYGGEQPLKIEVNLCGFKRGVWEPTPGRKIYDVNAILQMKAVSLYGYEKCRDIFDIAHILEFHKKSIDEDTLAMVREIAERVGFDLLAYKFDNSKVTDYLMENEDGDQLAFKIYSALGLGTHKTYWYASTHCFD